jgi:hypothetical protein
MPSFELPPLGSKTGFLRPLPEQKPLNVARQTNRRFFNNPELKQKRFGAGDAELITGHQEGLRVSYSDIKTGASYQDLLQENELLNDAVREAHGPQRPRASGEYDPTIPIGQQYSNLSPMPIDFQGNRRGGVYSSGNPVNTRFASFTDDEELVEDPTTSTNVSRPRTVAAAYSPDEEKLTILFLDRTFYNYYEVTMQEWEFFKKNYSKGPYIKEVLDKKPRGVASTGDVPKELLDHAFLSSRLNQIGKLTKAHTHRGAYQGPQTYKKPPSRKFGSSYGYKPVKLVKPRGKNAPKAPQNHAPSVKSVNASVRAAETARRNARRALGGF